MKLNDSHLLTQKSTMSDSSLQTNNSNLKSTRRLSSTIVRTSSRHQHLSPIDSNFLIQRTSSSFSIPILITTMNNFFQTISNMEEEIMLISRLKDMPVQELLFDNSPQPDTWYEVYIFLIDMRNQMLCACPFADEQRKIQERKYSNDDEGIIIPNNDSMQFSSASSTVSSEEFEHNSSSSFGTIRDELRFHYYGLFRSLDQLTSLANRVIEKYQEECVY